MTCVDLPPTPLALAENLPEDHTTSEMNRYSRKRTPAGLFRSAWCHIEYAMNHYDSLPDLSEFYFEYARDLTGVIVNEHIGSELTTMNALVLASYIPFFRRRVRGEDISSDDCRELYRSMGYALSYMQPLHPDDPPLWNQAEVVVLAMSARIGQPAFLLHPSSPREESSTQYPRMNHDSYFISSRGKLPIQQKQRPVNKPYHPAITMLFFEKTLDRALKKSGQPPASFSPADKLNYIIATIISETYDSSINACEKVFMDSVCSVVASHYFDASSRAA